MIEQFFTGKNRTVDECTILLSFISILVSSSSIKSENAEWIGVIHNYVHQILTPEQIQGNAIFFTGLYHLLLCVVVQAKSIMYMSCNELVENEIKCYCMLIIVSFPSTFNTIFTMYIFFSHFEELPNLPYARHDNPQFVYFLPTFWSSFMNCDLWIYVWLVFKSGF